MSIKIEKDIINYGENTSVTTYNLKDVYIEPTNNYTKVINNSLFSRSCEISNVNIFKSIFFFSFIK